MNFKKINLKVTDMTCISCEKRIENEIHKLAGISNATASNTEASVVVEYDSDIISDDAIKAAITKVGYTVGGKSQSIQLLGILFIGLAIYYLGNFQGSFDMSSKLQTSATLFVLFVAGVFTSIHCVGMCGGIMLSQSINKETTNKWATLKPTLLYNGGRVVSYTILGGTVGALGSVLSISLQVKAGISIFAGIFMIIMGFNMAGFGLFKKLNIRMPWSFCKIKNKSRTPLIVGLFNGLLPCGPLQTMQLYALGTGSAVMGALSMFIFSIGTIPLMLTFGLATGFLSKSFTKSILKFSGVLVLILGFVMANRGLALAGIKPISLNSVLSFASPNSFNSASFDESSKSVLKDGVQILTMEAGNRGYDPNVLFIQKGVPVKWIINGTQINSCNNQIVIPSMNKQVNLKSGENIIEFTPTGTEDINFSCWMGMLNGVIKVVDNISKFDAGKADVVAPASSTMSCCAGGGPSAPSTPSIFGNDISKVNTDRLVKVAKFSGDKQSITIRGIGYEFEPPIVVVKSEINTEITYDLKKFDTQVSSLTLVDTTSGKDLLEIEPSNNLGTFNYRFAKDTTYVILKDDQVINVITAKQSTDQLDLNKIRNEFLSQ